MIKRIRRFTGCAFIKFASSAPGAVLGAIMTKRPVLREVHIKRTSKITGAFSNKNVAFVAPLTVIRSWASASFTSRMASNTVIMEWVIEHIGEFTIGKTTVGLFYVEISINAGCTVLIASTCA